MNKSDEAFWKIFFDLFESLPRQGPGLRSSTAAAFQLCRELPPAPDTVDLGCGTGAQTLQLAELTNGSIVAVDNHPPFIERLNATLNSTGLAPRVRAIVADMEAPGLPGAGFDLVWSEGALYSISLEHALPVCRSLLRPRGYLAFTDAVWRKADPPEEIRKTFELDYPSMGNVESVIELLQHSGFEVLEHFTLPDEAWWAEFYQPMIEQIEHLKARHAGDDEALEIIEQLALEPELHRRYSEYYAYEFFVARARE